MTTHPDDGVLRRLVDEPQNVGAQDRAHAQSCEQCVAAMESMRADAARARDALSIETPVHAGRVLSRLDARGASGGGTIASRAARFGGLAVAAAFVAALFLTPLGGYARSFLTIFEPQQFQPITLSAAQMRQFRLLPQAGQIGTQRLIAPERRVKYASVALAAKHLSFAPHVPRSLPGGFSSNPAYFVHSSSDWTFTFSAAKARAFAARSHRTLPPMPADLDGTTIHAHVPAFFEAKYRNGDSTLEVVQVPAPTVSSTGASLAQLEAYLLRMPGISPQLVQQLQAIGDAGRTLPVPVELGKQHARDVSVHGARGLAIGDNTGIGAGVMWQQNGLLHFVAGNVSMNDALAVANDLE